jgi:hypothetical protein
MARKKASKSASNGILIVFAVLIAAVASIPKNAWIAIGVVVSVAVSCGASRAERRIVARSPKVQSAMSRPFQGKADAHDHSDRWTRDL